MSRARDGLPDILRSLFTEAHLRLRMETDDLEDALASVSLGVNPPYQIAPMQHRQREVTVAAFSFGV